MADAPEPQGMQLSPLLVAQPGPGGAPAGPNKVGEGARHLWEEFLKLPLMARIAVIGGMVALAWIAYARFRANRGSATPLGFTNADTGGVVGSNAPSLLAAGAAPNTDPTQPAQPALPQLVTAAPYIPPTTAAAQTSRPQVLAAARGVNEQESQTSNWFGHSSQVNALLAAGWQPSAPPVLVTATGVGHRTIQ